jgi:hypothetical protein
MDDCVPHHEKRIAELLELGRSIIAADPEIWTDAQKEPFKLRHSEKAIAARGLGGGQK